MRFIKAFLVGVSGLFIIVTLFSLLIPSKVQVVRTVLINSTSLSKVAEQVINFNQWKNWHPIFTTDSAVLSVTDNAAVYKIVHRGKELFITKQFSDSAVVKFLLQSKGENDLANEIHFTALPAQDVVQVSWVATTHLHWYPWEKLYAIFIDKLTGSGYEQALKGLKDYLEKNHS